MKYPAILRNLTYTNQVVMAFGQNQVMHMEGGSTGKFTTKYHIKNTKEITREYLSNTWGIVESKEHAEFIIELAELHGFKLSGNSSRLGSFFSFSFNGFGFLDIEFIARHDSKQITIPLPPKAKTEKPDLSKLPIHFDCVCNKCGGKCCIGNCDGWSEVGGDKAMNNIEWEDGAVCYAGGKQYTNVFIPVAVMAKDFQLNEICIGDCIPESELNTEKKYNDTVEVFELFGFSFSKNATSSFYEFKNNVGGMVDHNLNFLSCCDDGLFHTDKTHCKRKLTYQQLMTIGKLKRAMLEREKSVCGKPKSDFVNAINKVKEIESEPPLDISGFNPMEESRNKRNKSKQAYDILKSLDYEYDLDKQKWFRKEYI